MFVRSLWQNAAKSFWSAGIGRRMSSGRNHFLSSLSYAKPAPASAGDRLENVVAPALCVDLDVLEKNLNKMRETLRPFPNIQLRPHAKAHKSGEIALKLVEEGGAVGVCCQKLCEVEEMARWGVKDIFLSNELGTPSKFMQFAKIGQERDAKLSILVDNARHIELLQTAAKEYNITVDTLIEINVGQDRCGVEPGEAAVPLAKKIQEASHLRFRGIQAYQGWAQHVRSKEERRMVILGRVVDGVKQTVDALKREGIDCDIVTGGGTGTYLFEAESNVFNEIQPGSYIFMDADYGRNLVKDDKYFRDFGFSLFLTADIISRPSKDRAITDAGMKALSLDSGVPTLAEYIPGEGAVPRDEAVYKPGGDEHGILQIDEAAQDIWKADVGDRVYFIPGHCDPTVNLHDWLVGVRKGIVERVFSIGGRGPGY